MKDVPAAQMNEVLNWCCSVLGPFDVLSDRTKIHGGHDSATLQLQTSRGGCYVKTHQSRAHWHAEAHAYERWTRVFGDCAPRLLALRDDRDAPALLLSELPGQIVEEASLTPAAERNIRRAAGAALRPFHESASGTNFGTCRRDGSITEKAPCQAEDYVAERFMRQIERALRAGRLSVEEETTLHAAYELVPTFTGERPIPCHRDYGPANWLIDSKGRWTGVIDFEFSAWDLRVADFSRDPDWSWILRPDLTEALFEGYGRILGAAEEQQLLVAHAEYALSAILWGHERAFYGFEQEGRDALAHLASLLR